MVELLRPPTITSLAAMLKKALLVTENEALKIVVLRTINRVSDRQWFQECLGQHNLAGISL